ncbi:MAG TPA: alpha/beta hydrolase [Saprospiraceae bacterium]|nr:alpha/beta hydrolase [Saprospiraceae bacterium]
MEIKRKSRFKNPAQDRQWFENWVSELEQANGRRYARIEVETSLGKTHIWGLNTKNDGLETFVIFPGARTTALFWDFNKGLDNLNGRFKIYLVETNGLPNLSDGDTPDIHSLGYGEWAAEVFDQLNIQHAFIAGASFGGLVCMKLAIVAPSRVKAAFLLNPGCLQPFSLSFKNLYYNLLPMLLPSWKNVSRFLDNAVFCKPFHALSDVYERLIIEYELLALIRYKDSTQKPYYMGDELKAVTTDTFLLVGDKDLLFPYKKSVENARAKIGSLKKVIVFENVGHGIETFGEAIQTIALHCQEYMAPVIRVEYRIDARLARDSAKQDVSGLLWNV